MKKEVIMTVEEEQLLDNFIRHENKSIKILWGLYKGHYLNLFGSALFFIIKHSPVWALPIATANIVNAATTPTDTSVRNIIINIVVMAILLLQNIPTNYMHTKLYSKSVRHVEAKLRKAMVCKLQQLSITYHNEMQSGKLQSKIMRDVEQIETLSSQLFINVLNIILNIVVALTVTLEKSIVVFSFFLCTVPVAVLIRHVFRKRIKTCNTELRKEVEKTSARVMEMVELVPITRAHGLEVEEIHKMENQINQVADKGYKLDMVQTYFGSISWVAFQLFQVGCLGFTGYLAYKGTISIGEVVLYQSYFTTIITQVSGLLNLLPIIAKGLESINSVGDILLAHDVEEYSGKEALKDVSGDINFKGLCFKYHNSEELILNHLNLHIHQGETIALVGNSGAGKSTILNLIIGFIKPEEGQIFIDGKDMNEINLRSYRKHLAVVPQNTILFSGSIRDNITYGMEDVSEEVVRKAIDSANLTHFIEELPEGIETLINEHGSNLSGGQRQRIAIARALIRDPKIIILDEATSALDRISERKIQDAIENMAKNRTTIIVAHRLSTIKNADRIVVIKEGNCVESGTYEELIARKGEFYKFQAQ